MNKGSEQIHFKRTYTNDQDEYIQENTHKKHNDMTLHAGKMATTKKVNSNKNATGYEEE